MINIKDVTPLDLLPEVLRKHPKIQAAGYAMGKTAHMLLDRIDATSVYAQIDILPEELVDLLAVEFRAQYYNRNAQLQEKREAVKKALLWYRKAGTAAAVIELCEFLYGKSGVQEWFSYGGRPYTFRAEMFEERQPLNPESIENCIRAIRMVKNTRSLLEALVFHRRAYAEAHSGVIATSYMRQPIVDYFTEVVESGDSRHAAGKAMEAFWRQPIVDFAVTRKDTIQENMAGIASVADRQQTVKEG